MDQVDIEFETGSGDLGKRLDVAVLERVTGISRARIQLLIRNRMVTVDGRPGKPSMQMRPGQAVRARLSMLETLRPAEPRAEKIDLDILFEDDHLVAINKPPGMVVHPAKGHWSGTLTAGLMYRFKNLSSIGGDLRPGIVHRLDRDTSGVIVVAKHDRAHTALMRQFEKRTVQKRYLAVVVPAPDRDRDRIEAPIGVHPYQREKMAVRQQQASAKSAKTFFEVSRRLGRFAVLNVLPKTGRTHQIRVHLAHIGSPIVADRLYSGRSYVTAGWVTGGIDGGDRLIERQALHAASIGIRHPDSGQPVTFSAPLPGDITRLIGFLESAAC